jgi:hypothetical protein
VVGEWVDQDKAARCSIDLVRIVEKRLGRRNLHAGDLGEIQRFRLFAVQRIDIDAIVQRGDKGTHLARRMLQQITAPDVERFFAHPTENALELRRALRQIMPPHNHIPTADVDLVGQAEDDRITRSRFGQITLQKGNRVGSRRQRLLPNSWLSLDRTQEQPART